MLRETSPPRTQIPPAPEQAAALAPGKPFPAPGLFLPRHLTPVANSRGVHHRVRGPGDTRAVLLHLEQCLPPSPEPLSAPDTRGAEKRGNPSPDPAAAFGALVPVPWEVKPMAAPAKVMHYQQPHHAPTMARGTPCSPAPAPLGCRDRPGLTCVCTMTRMTLQYFFMAAKSFSSCFFPSSLCHFLQYLVKAFFLLLCLKTGALQ